MGTAERPPVLAGLLSDGTADPGTAATAGRAWRAAGLVALPTETVYGLAADAQDPVAVARIYAAKGRPADHPLIVHVAGVAALRAWSAGANPAAEALADRFWPGPLTIVVRRSARAGDHITGGQDTVAVRCPGHPVALAALRALGGQCGDPARGVAAPSANRFGRVSPTSAADVMAELGDRLDPARDIVIDGGPSAVGVESTIVDCTVLGASRARVLRPGAIGQAQIDAVLASGGSQPAPVGGQPGPVLRAPGSLDSHYAPAASLVVLPAGVRAETALAPSGAGPIGLIAMASHPTPLGWSRIAAPETVEQYAHDLYAGLRRADGEGLSTVVALLPDPGLGPLALAVADRLGRAAHG